MDYLIADGSGLGDVLGRYYGWGCLWGVNEYYGYLEDICKKTGMRADLWVYSANTSVGQLYEANPYIQRVTILDYGCWHQDHKFLDHPKKIERVFPNLNEFKWAIPEVHLWDVEKKYADDLLKEGVICIHPFAGSSNRAWGPHLSIGKVVDLINKYGKKAVILGGDSFRQDNTWHRIYEKCDESELSGKQVEILVNKTPVRLQAYLASKCQAMICSWSCYSTAALCKVRTCVVLPPESGSQFPYGNSHHTLHTMLGSKIITWDIGEQEIIRQIDSWLQSFIM